MIIPYSEFLDKKSHKVEPSGFNSGNLADTPLFPFQRALCRWALFRGRSLVAADTGLGKTLIELEWGRRVAEHTFGRVLLLAPLCVAQQTECMADDFGYRAAYRRDQNKIGAEDIVCANYEMMDVFANVEFSGVILDESSILKHRDSKTRAAIVERFRDTPYKLSATATPAPNDYMELGNQAEFLGVMTMAEMLAMFFTHDGGETSKWRLKGHGASKFWEWFSTWASVIRKPSDLGFSDDGYNLPPLNKEYHIIESKELLPGELFPKPASTLTERREAQRMSIDARVNACAERVNASDEQWVVWCHRNEESAKLAKLIDGSVEIVGSMSPAQKEASMNLFMSGERRVLVTKPSIAGFGLNLQFCRNGAFVGLNDSFEELYQAIRRKWRFGQDRQVNIHIYASDIEGMVVKNIEDKERRATAMADEMMEYMRDLTRREVTGMAQEKADYAQGRESGGNWDLHLGDCVEVLGGLDDDSIHYSIFSPPFSSLYTYSNSDRDMGNCTDDGVFFEHFDYLAEQLARVIMPGRLVSVHCMNLPTSKVNHGYIGIRDFRGDIIRLFLSKGFIFHSEVCIWKDPVTAMQRTKALGLLHKQLKKDSCMSRMGIPDYVVTMRKPGENPEPVSHTDEDFPVHVWQRYASPIWTGVNMSDTLQFRTARENDDERHIAPLQLEVIRRCLELWSNPDDLVLSPFAGIGSEGVVSIEMGRRFLGVELKRSYWDLAVKNLRAAKTSQLDLFAEAL